MKDEYLKILRTVFGKTDVAPSLGIPRNVDNEVVQPLFAARSENAHDTPSSQHHPTALASATSSLERDGSDPDSTHHDCRRFICQAIYEDHYQVPDKLEYPYGPRSDPTEFDTRTEAAEAVCILWVPSINYIKSSRLLKLTASVAVCFENMDALREGVQDFFSVATSDDLQRPPSRLMPAEKQRTLIGIGKLINRGFAVAISQPA